MKGSVYVAHANGLTKVGMSDRPRLRLTELRCASKAPGLRFAFIGRCADRDTALFLERGTHYELRRHHERGDWFSVSTDAAIEAIKRVAASLGLELAEVEGAAWKGLNRSDPAGDVTSIRLSPEIRAEIDRWAAKQEDKPPRTEAIRRLVKIAIKREK